MRRGDIKLNVSFIRRYGIPLSPSQCRYPLFLFFAISLLTPRPPFFFILFFSLGEEQEQRERVDGGGREGGRGGLHHSHILVVMHLY